MFALGPARKAAATKATTDDYDGREKNDYILFSECVCVCRSFVCVLYNVKVGDRSGVGFLLRAPRVCLGWENNNQ